MNGFAYFGVLAAEVEGETPSAAAVPAGAHIDDTDSRDLQDIDFDDGIRFICDCLWHLTNYSG